ncbi:hypothetical protein J25TS5_36790 [Paenibacillus faecis]|nr:hypothetical protein J25TS5_36790 [Paenibacillus faecis]
MQYINQIWVNWRFDNSNLDEYRIWYMTKENLALLNYPYEEDGF